MKKLFQEERLQDFKKEKFVNVESAARSIPDKILLDSSALDDEIDNIIKKHGIKFPDIDYSGTFIDFKNINTQGYKNVKHAMYGFDYTGDQRLLFVKPSLNNMEYVETEVEIGNRFKVFILAQDQTTDSIKLTLKEVIEIFKKQHTYLHSDLNNFNKELEDFIVPIIRNRRIAAEKLQKEKDELRNP